jgi:hypothetical protein
MKKELLAPNGKPSNLTPEQYKLVRTDTFKNWFGNWETDPENSSKVIDENGEPLVVYHGTNDKFNTFDTKLNRRGSDFGAGAYFSSKKENSKSYGKILIEAFLNIREPLVLEDRYDINRIFDYLIDDKKEGLVPKEITLQEYIIRAGANGIKINNPIMGEEVDEVWFVAYYESQIKLANRTNTTFDGDNPDIRFEVGGETKYTTPDYLVMFLGK